MLSPWQFQRETNHCNVLGPGPCLASPVQHYSDLQGDKKVFGSDDKMSGTLATRVPTTDTASEPKNTPVPIPSSQEETLEVEVGSLSKG